MLPSGKGLEMAKGQWHREMGHGVKRGALTTGTEATLLRGARPVTGTTLSAYDPATHRLEVWPLQGGRYDRKDSGQKWRESK